MKKMIDRVVTLFIRALSLSLSQLLSIEILANSLQVSNIFYILDIGISILSPIDTID